MCVDVIVSYISVVFIDTVYKDIMAIYQLTMSLLVSHRFSSFCSKKPLGIISISPFKFAVVPLLLLRDCFKHISFHIPSLSSTT